MDGANTAWILTSTALVLFMTLPGLALFYGGLVRSSNVLSVLMHCFAIACLASIVWLAIGYSLAFADGNAWVGGVQKAFFAGVGKEALSGDIPESVFFMFQMTFAIITPALIVGAYPERIKFGAVLLFSALWLVIVYAPVTHWIWGGGWLGEMGVLDFAGGLVVHLTAGVSALVIVKMLGSRRGFPTELRPPHSPGMTMMGASMLWVGWFGFNAGSALAANSDAGMAMLVTHISAATGSLVWLTIEWMKFGKPSLVGIVTGMVAGLATITPASGFVGPMGALIIGLCRRDYLLLCRQPCETHFEDRRFPGCLRGARRRWCYRHLAGCGVGRHEFRWRRACRRHEHWLSVRRAVDRPCCSPGLVCDRIGDYLLNRESSRRSAGQR